MARRNLFQPPPLPSSSGSGTKSSEPKTRFPNTGAMSGVKSTLKDLSSNAVREIPVEMIEEGGPKDRLGFNADDVATLSQSIKDHGQQVPIMVRPIPEKPGHYRIVYGRRRLQALRSIGQSAKALVRTLSDEEAILAQGQENSQRLDPSFIEKALFAAELVNSQYEQSVILDALAIDKPMLSRMTKVARAIPEPVIQAIGSAHGVGRRRWEDLADRAKSGAVDLEQLVATMDFSNTSGSDERFTLVSDTAAQEPTVVEHASNPRPAPQIVSHDGKQLVEIKATARALTLKLSKTATPEFTQWMCDNAETELKRLYEAWQSSQRAD